MEKTIKRILCLNIVLIGLYIGSGMMGFQPAKNYNDQNNDINVIISDPPLWMNEPIQAAPTDFVSTWNTSALSTASSGSNQIKLPLEVSGDYDFTIGWGDLSFDTITSWNQAEVTHTYTSEGVYTIIISGTIRGWCFNSSGDKAKLVEISQWGELNFGNSSSYFCGCVNLQLTAIDSPDLSGTTSLRRAFLSCESLGSHGNMNEWDVSRVINMRHMFYFAIDFNQNIRGWDVSKVTDMHEMFYDAFLFNQSIIDWDTSSVTNMGGMFARAPLFNQDIGEWDVSSVTDMSYMFYITESFDQNIGRWNVSNVADMENMFEYAALSTANYDGLLQGWAKLSLQNGVKFDAGYSQYSSKASGDRQSIIDNYGWVITDEGLVTGGILGYPFEFLVASIGAAVFLIHRRKSDI
ncbi:MAG: BspA family leucine-rich repeat surface protein [Promethearchaeota archaeon]|nr:MAG: BspA family leucine-rich repeat surface protein [Candidatus Lokiarchaeota archaeon]